MYPSLPSHVNGHHLRTEHVIRLSTAKTAPAVAIRLFSLRQHQPHMASPESNSRQQGPNTQHENAQLKSWYMVGYVTVCLAPGSMLEVWKVPGQPKNYSSFLLIMGGQQDFAGNNIGDMALAHYLKL